MREEWKSGTRNAPVWLGFRPFDKLRLAFDQPLPPFTGSMMTRTILRSSRLPSTDYSVAFATANRPIDTDQDGIVSCDRYREAILCASRDEVR